MAFTDAAVAIAITLLVVPFMESTVDEESVECGSISESSENETKMLLPQESVMLEKICSNQLQTVEIHRLNIDILLP